MEQRRRYGGKAETAESCVERELRLMLGYRCPVERWFKVNLSLELGEWKFNINWKIHLKPAHSLKAEKKEPVKTLFNFFKHSYRFGGYLFPPPPPFFLFFFGQKRHTMLPLDDAITGMCFFLRFLLIFIYFVPILLSAPGLDLILRCFKSVRLAGSCSNNNRIFPITFQACCCAYHPKHLEMKFQVSMCD